MCSPFSSRSPAMCTSLSQMLVISSRTLGTNSCRTKQHFALNESIAQKCVNSTFWHRTLLGNLELHSFCEKAQLTPGHMWGWATIMGLCACQGICPNCDPSLGDGLQLVCIFFSSYIAYIVHAIQGKNKFWRWCHSWSYSNVSRSFQKWVHTCTFVLDGWNLMWARVFLKEPSTYRAPCPQLLWHLPSQRIPSFSAESIYIVNFKSSNDVLPNDVHTQVNHPWYVTWRLMKNKICCTELPAF